MAGSNGRPDSPPGRTAAMRRHYRISSIRAIAAMLYVGWAAWYSWPLWWRSSAPQTFDGLLLAIPGLPWSFGLVSLVRELDSRLLVTCWLVNAGILYWYSGVWERWLRRRAERPW